MQFHASPVGVYKPRQTPSRGQTSQVLMTSEKAWQAGAHELIPDQGGSTSSILTVMVSLPRLKATELPETRSTCSTAVFTPHPHMTRGAGCQQQAHLDGTVHLGDKDGGPWLWPPAACLGRCTRLILRHAGVRRPAGCCRVGGCTAAPSPGGSCRPCTLERTAQGQLMQPEWHPTLSRSAWTWACRSRCAAACSCLDRSSSATRSSACRWRCAACCSCWARADSALSMARATRVASSSCSSAWALCASALQART